jgi:hypothetical protein
MLETLDISSTQFRNQHDQEFRFLRQLVHLDWLNMNYCFEEANCSTVDILPTMYTVSVCEMAGLGLISIARI